MARSAVRFQPQLVLPRYYHVPKAPRLTVTKVSLVNIMKKWMPLHLDQHLVEDSTYYIECSREGAINWQTAQIFGSSELVGRNHVTVILLKGEGIF